MRMSLLLLVVSVHSEINTSSQLNCDFTTTCRWRNSSDDSSEWGLSNQVSLDGSHNIMPMSNDESSFLYTQGLMGRSTAVLISDVVSCQLGGANLKYWYYKTGQLSQLQVCIRQPPGSKELGNIRCYDGLSSTHGQQWILRIIELPPSSQPFEILFQATFYPPLDIIAIDDILFDAALCVGVLSVQQEGIPLRYIRAAPPVIGFRDWQLLRNSEHFKGQTMLIVSQNYEETHREENIKYNDTTPATNKSKIETTTSDLPHTTALNMHTSTISENINPEYTMDTVTNDSQSPERKILTGSEDHIYNFVRLLKETAPILPYIPTLVRSLTTGDVSTGKIPLGDVRYSPVKSQQFYNTGSIIGSIPPLNEQLQTNRPNVLLELLTVTEPSSTMSNVFGISSTTLKPIQIVPTVYPATLIHTAKVSQLKKHLQRKSTAQVSSEDINALHGKLFKSKDEVIVFKKATKTENELATQLAELARVLPTDAMNDLQALQNVPDLEGLLQGMDLSLIRKPGGFAKLRQQFIQRFMKRSMGLPFTEDADKSLTAPIVPVKVTKKAMKQRAFRVAKLAK